MSSQMIGRRGGISETVKGFEQPRG